MVENPIHLSLDIGRHWAVSDQFSPGLQSIQRHKASLGDQREGSTGGLLDCIAAQLICILLGGHLDSISACPI